jgi:cytosine/adenosine deaminase-related metal-dependent hydrolase
MILTGTVIVDSDTILDDGAILVEGSTITAVGSRSEILKQNPNQKQETFDVVAPGLIGGHIHSVQSLGRGIADDHALLDWLSDYVLPMEAALTAEETTVAAKLAYLEMIESGMTGAIDHLTVHHSEEAIKAAQDMGIRTRIGKVLMDQNAPKELTQATDKALQESEDLLESYHETGDGRIKYALTPRFAVSCSEACLRGVRELANRYEDVIIHTHSSENRDEIASVEAETGMRNIHWLNEVGLTGGDVVLAHCVWTNDSERKILARTETNVTFCPSSNMKLASGIAPIEDYLDRGINVAIGNDGPPCNNTLDPFTEMRNGSLLQKVDELNPEALPSETIFDMATINGAQAAGFDRVGKLKEGWKADVIGLNFDSPRTTPVHDVLSHLVYCVHGSDVEFTMVDGKVLQENGRMTGVDRDSIMRLAQDMASRFTNGV